MPEVMYIITSFMIASARQTAVVVPSAFAERILPFDDLSDLKPKAAVAPRPRPRPMPAKRVAHMPRDVE